MKGLISQLIDGELSLQKTESVRRHLTDCAVCRKEFDVLKSLDSLLCDIKPVESSYDFARNFWNKIDALENKKQQWSFFKKNSWGWRPALGAVAALLVIATGTVISYRSAPTALDPSIILISENMALYRDYEIVNNLELLENWDEILAMGEI